MKKARLTFNSIRVHHFPWILAVVLVVFLTAGILLCWLAGERSEQVIIERVKAQELALPRSGAFSIFLGLAP